MPPRPSATGRPRPPAWSGPWWIRTERLPPGVDPESLELARQLAGAGDVVVIVGRPSLAEDGVLVAEAAQALARALPGRPVPPRPPPGQRPRRPRHGAGPRGASRPGLPRRRAGVVRRGLGVGPRSGDGTRPASWPRRPGSRPTGRSSGRWWCWARTRWVTSPTAPWPGGPSTGPRSWWRWPPPRARSPTPPTWCCRPPRPTSGRAPPPTSRAGSAGWARSWCHPDRPGPTG